MRLLRRLAIASDAYLNEIRDDEGRPLGEMRAVGQAGVEMTLRPCPYMGSRHGLPMAVASLKQVSKHWDAVIGALAELRAHYVSRGATLPLTSFDFWRIGKMAESVPAFLLSRADRAPQPLPATTAALFKSILGVNAALSLRFVKHLLDGAEHPTPPAETLFDYSETQGWLVGHQRVCAGSESMIQSILDVLANGGVVPSRAAVNALPDDGDALHEYAHHLMRLALLLEIVEISAGLVAVDIVGEIARGTRDAAGRVGVVDDLARFVTAHDAEYGVRQRDADGGIQGLRRLARTLRLLDDGSESAATINEAADRVAGAWAEPSADAIATAGAIVGVHPLRHRVVNGLPVARVVSLWATSERIAMIAARSTERALARALGEQPPVISLARIERPRATAPVRRALRELYGVTAKHLAAWTLISVVPPRARASRPGRTARRAFRTTRAAARARPS